MSGILNCKTGSSQWRNFGDSTFSEWRAFYERCSALASAGAHLPCYVITVFNNVGAYYECFGLCANGGYATP